MSEPAVPFKVKAIYEYKSDYDDDLTFSVGQLVTVTTVEDDEWFSGTYDGKTGMFPKNFVEILEDQGPAPPASRPAPRAHSTPSEVPKVSTPEQPAVDDPKDSPPGPAAPASTEHSKPVVKAPLPGVPMPGVPMPNQKINDPYSGKKQFWGGKSSYVPKVTPRDEYNIVGHHAHHNTAPADVEIVKSSTYEDEEAEKIDEPKVSLKERIALLQKHEQEEKERAAAALRKKDERKKKQAEEKERVKQKKEVDAEDALHSPTIAESAATLPERRGSVESRRSGSSDRRSSHATVDKTIDHADLEANEEDDDIQEEIAPEVVKPRAPVQHASVSGQVNEDEDEDAEEDQDEDQDDEEEVEDDEELKRKKLVERMAKMSGGRNMFGMMGMASPFGAQVSVTPVKKTKPRKDSVETVTVPMSPPKVPQVPANPTTVVNDESEEVTDPAQHLGDTRPDLTPRESSSLAEDDDPSDGDEDDKFPEAGIAQTKPEDITPMTPRATNFNDQIVSDGDYGPPENDGEIKITRQNVDSEPTGYDADEDLSDLQTSSVDASRTALPHIPFGVPSVPQVPKDIPQIPAVTMRGPPPPIPGSVPPTAAPPISPQSTHAPVLPAPLSPLRSRPAPPPIPSAIPPTLTGETSFEQRLPPPVPQEQDEDDDSSDSSSDLYESTESRGMPPPLPHAAPPTISFPKRASTDMSHAPAVPPSFPLSRASTGASIGSANKRSSLESTVSRTRSLKAKSGVEKTSAESALEELELELSSTGVGSNWWIRGELPEFLVPRIGIDLVYEVDSKAIKKRGNRTVNYRDYYVLFYDLSQLVLELEYESEDPRSTIHFVNHFTKPIPIVRKDLLEKYHRNFGSLIVSEASALVGSVIHHDNVASYVFDNLSKTKTPILQPIGGKAFGVSIYKNFNNNNISKIDEIKSGDIFWVKNATFVVHKNIGGNKSTVIGDSNAGKAGVDGYYAGIIYEFDPKKEKFKVIDSDNTGRVKRESYKVSDLKSGRIRVFRAVDRSYVDW